MFEYRNGQLFCERLPVKKIVEEVGTPCYLYSQESFISNYHAFDDAFAGVEHLICYAAKTNANLSILNLLARSGAGVDIVSSGELYKALKAGFKPETIVFAGVGKTEEEIAYALENNILMFNVESMPELELIRQMAKKLKKVAPVAFRVNPDINAKTHQHISTGLAQNKFGISIHNAVEAYEEAARSPELNVVGIQVHIGSQITTVEPFVESVEKVLALAKQLHSIGISISYVDLGGGLGITYKDETPPTPKELAKAVKPLIKETPYTYIFEPGRYIAGTAGILLTKVLYVKETHLKKFVIVDAGMNDLSRPVLYDAYHEILPIEQKEKKEMIVDIVGPICESSDYFARKRSIPPVNQGDVLAIFNAGAYGFSMASNYNARPRASEILVDRNKFSVIRERETFEDLVAKERLTKVE